MATKGINKVELAPAEGIKNVFVNDWKKHFFDDNKKRIASIPFMRNLIEFTVGELDSGYLKLTSLLHWKQDSASITQADLDAMYRKLFPGMTGTFSDAKGIVTDFIHQEAGQCLGATAGVNFENKVVLSVAIRLAADEFMVGKIADPAFVASITANQTRALLDKYEEKFPSDATAIRTLRNVTLMTPENIHLNAFMYEPILDMSDDHLRKLYQEVRALK